MDHQSLSFATTCPSTRDLGTSDVKQGDSLPRSLVILCFGYEYSVFESEGKRFFGLFDIKTYSQRKEWPPKILFLPPILIQKTQKSILLPITSWRWKAHRTRATKMERENSDKELEVYADELLADEWLAIYIERKTDEELEKQLQCRLNGRVSQQMVNRRYYKQTRISFNQH